MHPPSLRGRSPKQSPVKRWTPLDGILRLIGDCFDGRAASRNDGKPRDCFVVAVRLLATTWLLFLSSCAPVAPQIAASPQLVNVYVTFAVQPWLTEVFDCAAKSNTALNMTDPDSADVVLRIGEPDGLVTPAYQIDTEEILVVTHRESNVQNLTLDEVRALFGGRGDPSVQVWVYDSGEDVQEVFEQAVMAGRGVTSFAKMAASPQQMSDLLNAEKDAVGILPKHWQVGDARIVYNAGTVPVLAITKETPEGAVGSLLACLQK